MEIQKTGSDDLLQVTVQGPLDNESAQHFRNEIESSTREGWHRIIVDLGAVNYLSSAGIAALLSAKQQIDRLNGLFGIFNLSPEVTATLSQVKLLDQLLCDPRSAKLEQRAGSMTMALSDTTRFAREDGVDLEIYPIDSPQPVTCRIFGNPDVLHGNNDVSLSAPPIKFQPGQIGIGIGTLHDASDEDDRRLGELLAVGGAIAQSPKTNGSLPDYSLAQGDFVPHARFLYGIQCQGTLPTLIRFEPSEPGDHIRLSTFIRQALQQTNGKAAAFSILADCAGLVGAQIRQTPNSSIESLGNRFEVPAIRRWLSFTPEMVYRRNLALIIGIAAAADWQPDSPLRPFLRPLGNEPDLLGHFHAAVFPYQPMKKRTLRLQPTVTGLFEMGAIEDVLHLIHDQRPISGAGESELLSGACWMGELNQVEAEEAAR